MTILMQSCVPDPSQCGVWYARLFLYVYIYDDDPLTPPFLGENHLCWVMSLHCMYIRKYLASKWLQISKN